MKKSGYVYEEQRSWVFTDHGNRVLVSMLRHVERMLNTAGAFQASMAFRSELTAPSSWETMAVVDRLVELGVIREIKQPGCAWQDRVFVRA